MLTMAASSAPTEPAVWKSVPDSRSVQIVVTMLDAVASAGAEIDHPVFTPKPNVFVALKVAPPVDAILVREPQIRVHVPLAHEIVAAAIAVELVIDVGADCVPVATNPVTV